MLGALIGGAGSLVGGLVGAGAQQQANDMNYKINLLNHFQRQAEQEQRMKLAQQTLDDQKLGGTDAFGNTTRFEEGKGWVTSLSQRDKTLADLQRDEQLNVLKEDLPARRKQQQRNTARQEEESGIADRILKSLFTKDNDARDIKSKLDLAAAKSSKPDEAAISALVTRGMRTGVDTSSLIDALRKTSADSLDKQMAGNDLKADEIARTYDKEDLSQKQGLYNFFASRSAQIPGVAYNPEDVSGTANNLYKFFAGQSQQGNSIRANAANQQGGTMDYVQPNTGYGDAIAGGFGALYAGLERDRAGRDREELMREGNTF
jgi:hypothetical protein